MSTPYKKFSLLYDIIHATKDYKGLTKRFMSVVEVKSRIKRGTHNGSMLEIACGTGRFIEHFSKRYDCVGLDISSDMLEIARRRCPSQDFFEGDMADFSLGRTFDVVACLYGSIAYARTSAKMKKTVQRMAEHTSPGGVVLIEPWSWSSKESFLARHPQGSLSAAACNLADISCTGFWRYHCRGNVVSITLDYAYAMPRRKMQRIHEVHKFGLFSHKEVLLAMRNSGLSSMRVASRVPGVEDLYVGVKR